MRDLVRMPQLDSDGRVLRLSKRFAARKLLDFLSTCDILGQAERMFDSN